MIDVCDFRGNIGCVQISFCRNEKEALVRDKL